MDLWMIDVPTYHGARIAAGLGDETQDFAAPHVPVAVSECEGLRIVLGNQNTESAGKPDIQIERRINGWAIFIHADEGGPCALIYILDDGRSYCALDCGALQPIKIVEQEPVAVDGIP